MRAPIAAGILYPTRKELLNEIHEGISKVQIQSFNSISALFLPDGKYETLKELYFQSYAYLLNVPESVTFVFLSNNKSKTGKPVSISNEDWLTPFGKVFYDNQLGEEIKRLSDFAEFDNYAHSLESSIEVHLPFIYTLVKKPKVVCITLSISNEEIIKDLVNSIETSSSNLKKEIIIISSCGFLRSQSYYTLESKFNKFINIMNECKLSEKKELDNFFRYILNEEDIINQSVFLIPFLYSVKNNYKPRIVSYKNLKSGIKEEAISYLSIAYVK